jgi:hypothetical protein
MQTQGKPKVCEPSPDGLLIRVLQQPILDQPSHSAVPRSDGTHAKTGLLIEDDVTGPGVRI